MGLGNDGPHVWARDGKQRWRCVNCVMLRDNSSVPDGRYSCNSIKVAAEKGILGNPGDCEVCGVPDGVYRFDGYVHEILNEYRIVMLCDDCEKENCDDI